MTLNAKMRVRRSLPIDQWPAIDQRLWSEACAPVTLFDDVGDGLRHLAEITRRRYSFGWGCWIAFLAAYAPDALELSPAERCPKENVQAYIDYMRANGNADSTIVCRLLELAMVTKALDPSFSPRFLNRVIAILQAKVRPVRSKAHIPRADELVELGFRLMEEALDHNRIEDAITFRDGLIIAFLALHPVRIRNLTNFHLDANLIRKSNGFMVVFRSVETKTGSTYEVPLADVLVEPMDKYLSVCRPVLISANGGRKRDVGTRVWISSHGSPMCDETLREHIKMRTRVAFGNSVSPHAFRDAAATTLVVADPARVRAAAPLLGHRSLATTEKHYIQAKGLEAQRTYLDFLSALKKEKTHG
jgi:integrase/recombinase XerD